MATSSGWSETAGAAMQQVINQMNSAGLANYTGGTVTNNPYGSYNIPTPAPTPYPDSSMVISLLTLMIVAGPEVTKRLVNKLGLSVDDDTLKRLEDAVRGDTNDDLNKVVEECAKELKV